MQKKILIITDNLPDQINGVVTTYKNIETHALLDGYKFVYLTPNDFTYIDCPFYNEIKLAYPRQIGKKIEEICPDHIHIATEGPIGLWARAYLTKHNYSYNTAYHTKFPEGLKKLIGIPEFITWSYIKWFHKHTGRVLSTTDSMAEILRKKRLTNIVPWTRGVNRNIFNSSQRNINSSEIVLLSVGRVSKEKNLDKFCQLQIPNSKKILVGDGPYLSELKLKYSDVEFTGYKTGKDLSFYMANADVFVMPSIWETFGIVMIEAMACGTPVAAYPIQGPLDVVEQGVTGFLHEDLNEAIKQCLLLDRNKVFQASLKWCWEDAWNIFKDNLIEKTQLNNY
ncbi:glycosyltransferase family 1 protein [bacterium]|nr:glycosyltransferase family 1 protein [bacterium]